MKITMPASLLHECVSSVMAGVASRTTMPILTNVKIVVKDGIMSVSATDLELSIARTCLAEGSLSAVVEPKRLAAILKEISGDVTLSMDKDSLSVRASGGRWTLPSMSADEFPDGGIIASGCEFKVLGGRLRQAYRRVAFAVENREDEKFMLKGILVDVKSNSLSLAATDTNAVAHCEVDIEGVVENPSSCIVPVKALRLAVASIGSDEQVVTVIMSANGISFATDNIEIRSRILAGKFPPYQKVIPKEFTTTIKLPLRAFASKLRLAAITADKESRRVNFSFNPSSIGMKSSGYECGDCDVVLDVADGDYQGDPLDCSLDPAYLLAYLGSVSDESTVTVELTKSKAVFRTGNSFYFLAMMVLK